MPLAENINFFTTLFTSGCVCFAASNFGIKLGRLTSFQNTSGYKYVSETKNKDKLYNDIVKVHKDDDKAPKWTKSKEELEKWCSKHEKSLRFWELTSKYCLIQNNVRHQLIDKGYTIKEDTTTEASSNGQNMKCSEILNLYSDDSGDSMAYLIGRNKCTEPAAAAAAK